MCVQILTEILTTKPAYLIINTPLSTTAMSSMYWWILKRGLDYNMLYQTCSILDCLISLGLYSLSGKTSCRKISWCLEAARFDVEMFISLWNLTGISAALLLRCLTHFGAIGKSEILNLAASRVRSALPRIIQRILFDMIDVYLKDFKSKVFISHTQSKTTHPPHTHTHMGRTCI